MTMMKTMTSSDKVLHIDIETYSSCDIDCGVYKYAGSEDFTILLLAYAFDKEDVKVIDLANGEKLPGLLLSALTDPNITKIAHNANFERTCLARYLNKPMPPEQWKCSMIHAYYCGLPGSLKAVGKALDIDQKKMEEGKDLIEFFCKPDRFGNRAETWPGEPSWELFKAYCKRDVEAEREIWDRLDQICIVPPREWKLWHLDQKINDRGIGIDQDIISAFNDIWDDYEDELLEKAKKLAPGINLKSGKQLLPFLKKRGIDLPDLKAETLEEAIKHANGDLKEILLLRKELSRTALKKYETIINSQLDGRVRGILQFYGAHTGRWAGRLVQPQNLPRPVYYDLDKIRQLVLDRDLEGLKENYESVAGALSSIIRTVIKAPDNFSVADYSAIECRVVAWLADEQWVLDSFAQGKDIYCETASQMYGVPVEKNGVNGKLRQKGKYATLACGYGGAVGALKKFGADKDGMTEEEMLETVTKWRKANPHICALWRKVEKAARLAITTKRSHDVAHGVWFDFDGENLFCGLPSGRMLVYQKAMILDKEIRYYDKGFKKTWGGTLVENIVQAIARDCLATALMRLEQAGYKTVAHIHDEVVVESNDLQQICDIMGQRIAWADGLDLRAEGFISPYYKKD